MFLCQKSNTAQSNRVQNSMFDDLNSDSICPASWLVYLGVSVSSCCVTKYLPESVGLADSASRSRLAGASSRRKLCSLYPPWNSWPARTVFLIRGSVWRAGEEAKTCGHTPQAMPTPRLSSRLLRSYWPQRSTWSNTEPRVGNVLSLNGRTSKTDDNENAFS